MLEHQRSVCIDGWDLLGRRFAPLQDWEKVGVDCSDEEKICRLKLATDDMFDYHDMKETLESLTVFPKEHGPIKEDLYLTASPEEVGKISGIASKQAEPSPMVKNLVKDTKRILCCADIDEWLKYMYTVKEVQKTSTKMAPLLEPAVLERQNKAVLEGGVNCSGIEKLAQYEVHERLHRAYEDRKLKKTVPLHTELKH